MLLLCPINFVNFYFYFLEVFSDLLFDFFIYLFFISSSSFPSRMLLSFLVLVFVPYFHPVNDL